MDQLWLSIHIIGAAIGTGSVTTAYARELYFKRHPELAAKRGSLPVITPLLNLAFALVIISGFALYRMHPAQFNHSGAFQLKVVLLLILVANHVLHNTHVRPNHPQWRVASFISNYISLLGWYALIVVSTFLH